jgi:drug/metabolite transporter (DMT)-like permease
LPSRAGVLASIVSGVLFGTSIPIIKLGLSVAPPFIFAFLRFFLASIIILIFLRRSGWVKTSLLKSRLIWTVAIVNTAGYVFQFEGQIYATASDAALIIGSAAVMIPIISRIRGTEKLAWPRGLGVLLGFVGAALVVTRGQALTLGRQELFGDLLILATAVTIALIFVYSKDLVSLHGDRAATGGLLLTTAVLLLPFTSLDLTSPVSLGLMAWLYVIFLAVVSTVGAYYFFAKSLETVSPTVSSIILPVEVIVSVLLSVIIFQDPFNLFSGTGAVLLIAGVVLVSYSS